MYAKATDTGVNPREAAKRLNIDWDTAAEIEDADLSDDPEVPAAVVCFLCPSFFSRTYYRDILSGHHGFVASMLLR